MVDPAKVFTDPKVVDLARSVANGDLAKAQSEIAAGANVKAVGQKGFTLLQFALYDKKNGPEMARLLLKAGVDPLKRLENGGDVPHYAAERDNADPNFLAALLDAGVSPNLVGGEGGNSLIDASVMGKNIPILKLLLDRGANVNYNHPIDGTALNTAATLAA